MELFGIKFAPLNIPLERRLQTLSAFYMFSLPPIVSTCGITLTVYILFYSNYWIIAVLYLIWIWLIDKDTPEKGARRSEMFCNLMSSKYARDYYPATLKFADGFALDAKRNYFFCAYPHGVLPIGTYLTIVSNSSNFNELFPYHKVSGLTVNSNFKLPLFRDILLLMGSCSTSAKSIKYLLNYPGGGRIAALSVGGAEECFYARPGAYQIILKNRKGFIKLALQCGSPLVPVFSFGEIELFGQVTFPKGSLMRRFQEWFKSKTGAAPIIIFGRGFFQYTFGLVPRRKPLNVVVGTPIEVQKNENPTQEEIDNLHSKFATELTKIFNTYKHQYIKNPEHASLIIS